MIRPAFTLLIMSMFVFSSAKMAAAEPTIVACKFEKLPLMLLIYRGGMGAKDNTLQVGDSDPIPMAVGSGFSTANTGSQEFIFSLRLPASVTITNVDAGGSGLTYHGECISSLPR